MSTSAAARLAVIGAGSMAKHHIDAAREVGFDVVAVAASEGSTRAQDVARTMGIPKCWRTPRELIDSDGWDAAVVAIPVTLTLEVVVRAAQTGRPVLAEKPLADRATELVPVADRLTNVRVAYNRRFLKSSLAAKQFACSRGPAQVLAQIPEAVARASGLDRGKSVRHNSVHVLDLLRFLFGSLEVLCVEATGSAPDDRGRTMLLRSVKGDLCTVYANWNKPANFSIAIDSDGERFELRPLEFGYRYAGMNVQEPTEARPLRMYHPRCVEEIGLEPEAYRFKPGFLGQMRAFYRLVTMGSLNETLATVEDAIAALTLADEMVHCSASACGNDR